MLERKPRITKGSRFQGCLLGGAVGDALGAPVEFMSWDEIKATYGPKGIGHFDTAYGRLGAITDDTQMTLFTAEGMLRAFTRGNLRGICHPPSVVHHAYIQWLNTQGEDSKSHFNRSDCGRLHAVCELQSRRAPGNSCLSALRQGEIGTTERPISGSKGCGGIMRAAPVGLIYDHDPEEAFRMGCEIAALTHGHPTGYLAAGFFAALIAFVVKGTLLPEAIAAAADLLKTKPSSRECLEAIDAALAAHTGSVSSVASIEKLGGGWVAEEALAISLYCSLCCQDDFKSGVILAVNHSGDSDSTGSITGNILGALLGKRTIPRQWLKQLELVDLIETLAKDLIIKFQSTREWWDKYPGV